MATPEELAGHMEGVARLLCGEPNARLSKPKELRFGTNGSTSVDLEKGTYFDNEVKDGGGVLKLIETKTGLKEGARFDWLREHGFEVGERSERKPNGKAPADSGGKAKIVATYDYVDEAGDLLFQVCRMEPKNFLQRRKAREGDDPAKVKNGWVWSVKGARQVPYNLPKVLDALAGERPIVIVEGEKDVENLAKRGVVATCNAGGAGKWPDGMASLFLGAEIVMLPDNDQAGEDHIALVGRKLASEAASIKVLRLEGLPPKGDVSDWLENGGKIEDLIEQMEEAPKWSPPAPGLNSRFGAVRFRDLDQPAREYDYLIKGVLTRYERSLLVGASGSGKSFLATHAGVGVARGEDVFGRRTRKGLVVYQAGEGALGLKKRLRAIRQERGIPASEDLPFVLLTSPVDLYNSDADTTALIAEIKAWAAVYKAEQNVDLELIVIDTLSAATPGANENASEDISKILNRLALIANACGSHVMLVHHFNAAGTKARGHSSLFANIENAIEVTVSERTCTVSRPDGSTFDRPVHVAKIAKQKDEERGLEIEFALKRVVLGKDIDGDPITSCVVVGTKEDAEITLADSAKAAERKSAAAGFRLSKQEGIFFRCVLEALNTHGVTPPAALQLPHSITKVVDYEHVKMLFARRIARDEDNSEAGRKKHKERFKSAIRRARETLTTYQIIGVDSPLVWWTGKPVRGFDMTLTPKQSLVGENINTRGAAADFEDDVL